MSYYNVAPKYRRQIVYRKIKSDVGKNIEYIKNQLQEHLKAN